MSMKVKYKRILLKLSGEALQGDGKFGFERSACEHIARSIKEIHEKGVEIGIVIGGGNVFRGAQASLFDFARTPADQIGMLATIINGLVLQQSLAAVGVESRVMSALSADSIVEKYNWKQALLSLQKKIPVIFVGGTGNPYFTTDTAGSLRASEMSAEILLKASTVDGVYTDDPKKNPKATKYSTLTYSEALAKNLKVMDATAIALCRENRIPIYVFNLFEKGALLKAICEERDGVVGGTIVQGE
ncbi:MAG: UMP kinase [Chlamydiales bacterium]|nr:UMP kinase [Chlamydiales bacterium]